MRHVFSLKAVITALSLLVSNQGLAEITNIDPFEKYNRQVWRLNSTVDRWVLKPLAEGYKAITPDIVEQGLGNVFRNISNVPTALNNMLQGKPGQAGQDIARFIFNITFGGFGLYDFSSDIGLPVHEEDFGQTLGVWGVPQGPYIVLPFLGPSGVRDTFGWLAVDNAYDPYDIINPSSTRYQVIALRLVDFRARLLRFDNIAPGDDYLFFRDAYLQRRAGLVRDGRPDPAAEDNFLDDF